MIAVALATASNPEGHHQCAPAGARGGDWKNYGRGLNGDRYQPAERSLGPAQVKRLQPLFVFAAHSHGMSGLFQSSPSEAFGCVYAGTSDGWVASVNADTGKLVWKKKLPVGEPGLLGSGVIGAPAVRRHRVFVNVSQATTPYAAALDRRTGRVLWRTRLVKQPDAYNDASPVVYHGLVFSGFNGDEEQPVARGGFTILDARTGRVLARRYTVPKRAYKRGYNGGSIWATAAVDRRHGYAYVGTGNPQGPKQHKYTDAILKIDLDRSRPTFAHIVDSYSGVPEAALPVDQTAFCKASQGQIIYVVSAACTHQDIDFGGSPQLFHGTHGKLLVGELQKSGIYHAVYTASMSRAWTTKVGNPAVITNGDSGATDGHRIYIEGTPPGITYGLAPGSGRAEWAAPVGDQIHFQPMATADGVVYTVDSYNNLLAWDADTGEELLRRPLRLDTGLPDPSQPNATSAGPSIARHTVYVENDEFIAAYRVPRVDPVR